MTNANSEHEAEGLELVRAGPSHRLAERLGLSRPGQDRRLKRILLLLLLTWAPLFVLAMISGEAFGGRVAKPFLHDPEAQARLLLVMPLLELAEVLVGLNLAVQARHFVDIGMIPESQRPGFEAAKQEANRTRESLRAELMVAGTALVLSSVVRNLYGFTPDESTWERIGTHVTPAGWWYMIVSLPIVYFLLLRWAWVFLLWARFLFRVSRLDLELTPTHPDRTGGLGFLGWGLASFATVVAGYATVFSSAFAEQILFRGESLQSLKLHVIVFVIVALFILHAPLLAFWVRLARCRFQGLLEFGALVWRHDRDFDEKWIRRTPPGNGESILGSSDVQSLADIATCYEHVDRMWLIPFDSKAFAVLALATLAPMLPLVGTTIPLQEIFAKLGELLI
jgi:hypothetical protein